MALSLLTSSLRTLRNLRNVNVDINMGDIKAQCDKVRGMLSVREALVGTDFSHVTQRKTRCQLFRLSAAVCGIEFCYAAETAFVSPILLKIGVPVTYMTLIWCLSPLLGFLLLPLLGSLSDRCGLRLGRRRPFIIALSVGIILGLLLVSNGQDIGVLLGDTYNIRNGAPLALNNTQNFTSNLVTNATSSSGSATRAANPLFRHKWSIVFTVIGVVLLDFSCDACQSPCRAYLLDVCVPADHSAGLSSFTVLAGLGGALGYMLGGVDWENTSFGASLGGHVRVVFTMVTFIYLICVIITVTAIREVPLSELAGAQEAYQKKKKKVGKGRSYHKFTNEDDSDDNFPPLQTNYGTITGPTATEKGDEFSMNRPYDDNSNVTVNGVVSTVNVDDEIMDDTHHNTNGYNRMTNDIDPESVENGFLQQNNDTSKTDLITAVQEKTSELLESEVSLKTYLKSIVHMPRSMFVLCVTNLFCWMSLVCYSLYFTTFVGQAVYGGDPSSPNGSPSRMRYEAGVRMGSFGMAMYSLSCAVYSMSIEKLVSKFGAKWVYIVSQLVYTVGSTVMALWRHPVAVILLSPTPGVMYATLFTMPYILIANYHSKNQFTALVPSTDSGQVRGLGTDVALVSSMVFVAQFLLSACMGSIIQAVGSTAAVVVAAAILSFCGAISATQVMYLDLQ